MESVKAAGTDTSVYLYCFSEGPPSLPPEKGINEKNATFMLPWRDLCAFVSEVPSYEYSEDILNRRLYDIKWLAPKVIRHDEIIKYVMKTRPVIPVKFGAIFTSSERLIELMRRGYEEFSAFFGYIRDKEEWGVKVYVDEKACEKTIESSSDFILELDRKISRTTPGQAYFLRKKRGNLILQETLCLQEVLSGEIYHQIAPQCVEAKKNKLLSKDATGKEEKMILNTALLLKATEVDLFKQKIDDMATFYQSHGLLLEISGPWPPYNFCPDFEAVHELEQEAG